MNYEQGRHDERQRTMSLIGGVRMDFQTGASGDALDKLVMVIASEPITESKTATAELDLAPIEARLRKIRAVLPYGAFDAVDDVDALIAEVKRQREEIQRLKTTSGE